MSIPYRHYVLWIGMAFHEQLAANWPELWEKAHRSGILCTAGTEWAFCRTPSAGTEWAFLQDAFRRGCEEAEKGTPGWQMWVYGNTMQLTADMMRALSPNGPEPPLPEKRELGPRRSLCGDPFGRKNHPGGGSFYRFVTQRRLIAAKSLILEGQPLTSVGEQVGFSDHSTFYRAFQKEYGVSPSQFRKRNQPANG